MHMGVCCIKMCTLLESMCVQYTYVYIYIHIFLCVSLSVLYDIYYCNKQKIFNCKSSSILHEFDIQFAKDFSSIWISNVQAILPMIYSQIQSSEKVVYHK